MDGTKPKKLKILPTSPPTSDFPSDVLRWMKRNASPKTALKLMQICKYFQHQIFPYFVLSWLRGDQHWWDYIELADEELFDFSFDYFDKLKKQLWLTDTLCLCGKNDLIFSLLPKIAVCDISDLRLINQFCISFEDFKILTAAKTVELLFLEDTVIEDDKNEAVPLEKIFEYVPNLCKLTLYEGDHNTIISHKQATKSMPPKLKSFSIIYENEDINVEECFKFIQNNQQIFFNFRNFTEMSAQTVTKLQILTKNLIENRSTEHRTPKISFIGQTTESTTKLRELEEKHRRQKKEKQSKT